MSGFCDADSTFGIVLSGIYASGDLNARGRVKSVFSINQSEKNRVTGESNYNFMNAIANFFSVNLLNKTERDLSFIGPAKKFVLSVQSNNKHFLVTSYFNRYPLMSSKYLNYLSYVKSLDYLGKQLRKKEISEIREIKNGMNKKKTYYNWHHLTTMY